MEGGETSSRPEEGAWWKTFRDPELDGLVSHVIRSNLTLRIAEARIREAHAQRDFVAGAAGPQFGADASSSANRYPRNGFPPLPPTVPHYYDLYRAGVDASWELDVFGGTRRAIEAADARVAAAEFGRDDVLRALLGEVGSNYVEARAYQQQLAIARENIEAQERIVTLTRGRYRAGLTTELDMRQAMALLATTQSQVPALETGFRTATYRLDLLLGQQPGKLLSELSKAKPIPGAPPQVPVGLPSDLLLRRPDIRRAERDLAASTALIGVATADLFPRFSLTGVIGLESTHFGSWWSPGSQFWHVGPAMVWHLFESGRLKANIRVQNARQEQALARYEQTVLVSFEEVESALTAYAKEQLRRESLVQSVQASQRAQKLADDLYRHGLADFLRVLVSQRALYQAQAAVVRSDRDVALDLVALYKALGGGWEDTGRS